MNSIREHIDAINKKKEKALSIFLTAGYPNKNSFLELTDLVIDNGADILELGIPFSDPLADGPIIQKSSFVAINSGITTKHVLEYSNKIAAKHSKPIILMGYANPIVKYGINNFFTDCLNSGVSGLIIPDVPIEEYDDFFASKPDKLDAILLASPTSTANRIKSIDEKSSGFVYVVSMRGTTGNLNSNSSSTESYLETCRENIINNKIMIGFGINGEESIKKFYGYCNGFIVGSAIIKRLETESFTEVGKFVSELKRACI